MKGRFYLSEDNRGVLCDLAHFVGVAFTVLALVLAVLTFVFPVGEGALAWMVLLRNGVSVVAMLILGRFLKLWAVFYSEMYPIEMIMNSYKTITILVAVACAVKVIVSIGYAIYLLHDANLTGLYYAGEVIVWGVLLVFFINYACSLVSDSTFLQDDLTQK